MRRGCLLAIAAVLASRCGGSPAAAPHSAGLVRLVRIAQLDQPVALATRPRDRALYVAEKTGKLVSFRDDAVRTVLDLSGRVSLGGEQGLLGVAFSPDGRYVYVDYTDGRGFTRIMQYRFVRGRAVAASARPLLWIRQRYNNHNGGELAFGPDGMLYVGHGDGAGGGDPTFHAQSLHTLLGKILRIDPTPRGPAPYVIPPDNPFARSRGVRHEIWAFGLRNPWRFSFDRATGDMWIGDVGQTNWEEIDRMPRGESGWNFGWNRFEGNASYDSHAPGTSTVKPVYVYPHTAGRCVVTGGYVYRGRDIPALRGTYVFGDFCTGELWGLHPERGGARARPLGPSLPDLSSFGENRAGELFAMSLSGGVYSLAPA